MKQNLSKIGNALSRQMKKSIVGGIESGSWLCTFTYTNGLTLTQVFTEPNGNAAQCAADYVCWSDNTCTNADCAGSGEC